jgi:hypothetical protein
MQSSAVIDTSSRERILTRRANQRHHGNLAQLARRVRPCSAGFPSARSSAISALGAPKNPSVCRFCGLEPRCDDQNSGLFRWHADCFVFRRVWWLGFRLL